jgi:hypothetical protein
MKQILLILVLSGVASLSSAAQNAQPSKDASADRPETVAFCDLVNLRIGYPWKKVLVRAVYRVGFEWSELYSLRCPGAPMVWIDFSDDWKSQTQRSMRKEMNKGEGTYGVTFVGKLFGGGFGHMGVYPIKLEVTSVEAAKRLGKQSYHPGALTPELRHRVEVFEAAR